MKKWFTAFAFLITLSVNAQDAKPLLYKGSIGGKMPVTMFLLKTYQDCTGEDTYEGMYKYDGKSNWLQVIIHTNEKNQMILVEYGATGVLLLRKVSNTLNGTWISPDGKRQLPVKLLEKPLKADEKDKLDKTFEELTYENYDC